MNFGAAQTYPVTLTYGIPLSSSAPGMLDFAPVNPTALMVIRRAWGFAVDTR